MGVYQTIDRIIENHKVALTGAAVGLTLFISAANYQPTYAAENKNTPPVSTQLGGGSYGMTTGGHRTYGNEGTAFGTDGITRINIKPNNSTATFDPTQPTFNYKTAKQYIDEANSAYKDKDYQKIIDLTEEALYRINQKQLKAKSNEISTIEGVKSFGYELVKKKTN